MLATARTACCRITRLIQSSYYVDHVCPPWSLCLSIEGVIYRVSCRTIFFDKKYMTSNDFSKELNCVFLFLLPVISSYYKQTRTSLLTGNFKAVVAGAAGPASAGPLFGPTMVSAVPFFSIAAAVLACHCSSNRLILNESRLIDEIILVSSRQRCENKHHRNHETCQNIAVIKMTPI